MTARPCALLRHTAAGWRPCGRPEPAGLADQRPVCGRCRRELARLASAGLADRARFATDPTNPRDANGTGNTGPADANATANPDANSGANAVAQTMLPLPPDPPASPRPWETVRGVRG